LRFLFVLMTSKPCYPYAERVCVASADITVEVECAEDDWAIIVVTTPIGAISIAGALRWEGRILQVTGAHTGGLKRGALGRKG
jgi:hypothetical protein